MDIFYRYTLFENFKVVQPFWRCLSFQHKIKIPIHTHSIIQVVFMNCIYLELTPPLSLSLQFQNINEYIKISKDRSYTMQILLYKNCVFTCVCLGNFNEKSADTKIFIYIIDRASLSIYIPVYILEAIGLLICLSEFESNLFGDRLKLRGLKDCDFQF